MTKKTFIKPSHGRGPEFESQRAHFVFILIFVIYLLQLLIY